MMGKFGCELFIVVSSHSYFCPALACGGDSSTPYIPPRLTSQRYFYALFCRMRLSRAPLDSRYSRRRRVGRG